MANFNLPATPTTPEGALAGYYRGTQYNYGIADLERQFRDSDLANQRLTNLYQNELLDNPMKEADRGYKIAEDEFKKGLIDSGAALDEFNTKLTHSKLQNELLPITKKHQELLNQKEEISQADEYLNKVVQTLKSNPLAYTGIWPQIQAEMKAKKIKVPDGPLNQETIDRLSAMAEGSRQTMKQLNALELQQERLDMQESLGILRAATSRANTQDLMGRPGTMQTPDKRVFDEAKKEEAATGSVSVGKLGAVAESMVKQDDKTLEGLEKQFIGEFQRKQAYNQLPQNFDVVGEARKMAQRTLTERNYERAWTLLGMPKIKPAELPALQAQAPEFASKVAKFMGTTGPTPSPANGSPTPAVVTPSVNPRISKGVIGGQPVQAAATPEVTGGTYKSAAYNNPMPEQPIPEDLELWNKYKFSEDQKIKYIQLVAKNLDTLSSGKIDREALAQYVLKKMPK